MIGQRLTMRATVERAAPAGMDGWGQPVAASFQPVAVVHCFAWSPRTHHVADGDKVADIEDVRIMLALGAGVLPGDEIAGIRNRAGDVLFGGRYRIEGEVQFKHTHMEAALRKVA